MNMLKRKNKNITRSYKYCLNKMKPNAGKCWVFVHWLDFNICKLLYPGIDGLDYFLYRFYDFKHSMRKTFITEGDLSKMVKKFNGNKHSRDWDIFENKKRFNTEFDEFIGHKWISDELSEVEFIEFCNSVEKIIIKPNGGEKGRGIFFSKPKNNTEIMLLYDKVHGNGYILEEMITQNAKLATLHPQSVNTLRVYTTRSLRNEKIYITCAVIRMGLGDSKIDNYSSGGIVAEIDINTGLVQSKAVDKSGNEYLKHPDTNITIKGFEIPLWKKVKNTVLKAHERVKDFNYIAWDVVVREDNSITFIEGNLWGGVHMQQQPSLIGKKELYKNLM